MAINIQLCHYLSFSEELRQFIYLPSVSRVLVQYYHIGTSVYQTNATRPIAFPQFIPAFFKLTATWELDWTLPRPAGEILGSSVHRSPPSLLLSTINTMSLKRKASFSAMPSSPFAPASSDWDMTDSSKHLHSRTRKRFRDGRPNDEAVYGESYPLSDWREINSQNCERAAQLDDQLQHGSRADLK